MSGLAKIFSMQRKRRRERLEKERERERERDPKLNERKIFSKKKEWSIRAWTTLIERNFQFFCQNSSQKVFSIWRNIKVSYFILFGTRVNWFISSSSLLALYKKVHFSMQNWIEFFLAPRRKIKLRRLNQLRFKFWLKLWSNRVLIKFLDPNYWNPIKLLRQSWLKWI